MEYTVSKKELLRRKNAFISLLFSLFVGAILFSYLFNFPIPFIGYVVILLIFIFFALITFRFLNSLSQTKIRISEKELQRVKGNAVDTYLLSNITGLKIKRRTNGGIREITMYLKKHKSLFINGIEEDFEELRDSLINKLSKDTTIKETREPIDFDHPLFYPILGLLISSISICFMKSIMSIDYAKTRILFLLFALYTFTLGLYFMIKKPISAGSGRSQKVSDYVFGIGMILASIFLLIIFYL